MEQKPCQFCGSTSPNHERCSPHLVATLALDLYTTGSLDNTREFMVKELGWTNEQFAELIREFDREINLVVDGLFDAVKRWATEVCDLVSDGQI